MPDKNIDIFFEENPNPMWIYDKDSLQIIDVNESALSLYGYNREEMLSNTIKDLRPKQEIPKIVRSAGKKIHSFQDAGTWKHKKKNGEIIYVHILAYPITIEDKDCELILAKDVTSQHQAEKKLEHKEKIFNTITENIEGTFFILNTDGEMIEWNNYVEQISGYTADELDSLNALEFFEDEEKPKIQKAIQEAFENGYVEVRGNLKGKHGNITPLLYKANRVELDGEDHIVGVGIDVSNVIKAKRESQQHLELLQAIIDQSQSCIYVKDKQNRLKFVNQAFLDLFDVEKGDVINKNGSVIVAIDKAKEVREHDDLVRKGQTPMTFEERLEIDGNEKTFVSTKTVLKGIDKFDGYLLGVSTDITDRKKTEQKLETSLKEKSILLAEIHHRVKNNLAIISGLMELEVMESNNEVLKNKLKDSQSRINSIALTHELLYQEQNFANITFSKNVTKLVNQSVETFGGNIEVNYKIQPISLNINQALPCSLIINEIVTNAIKHAFDGIEHPTIDITIKEEDSEIYLKILDNGIGLPDDLDLESPTSLGLNLINTLLTQLKAELDITTNNGTCFEIWFTKTDLKGTGNALPSDDSYV